MKYKETAEKFHLLPLVDARELPAGARLPVVEKSLEQLK